MKHALVTLLFCFGITSVAYAQEPQPVTLQATAVEKVRVAETKRVELKEARDTHLQNKKQALDARAEIKQELREEALETKAELKAKFEAATSTEAKQAIREEAAMEKKELQETAQEYREDWRANVKEYFKQRIEFIFTKFDGFIEKAESAETRIMSVLETLQDQGVDTSTVEAKVQEAAAKTASAKERMRTVRASLEVAVETGSKEEVRIAFNEAKEELKTVQRELKSAFSSVREAIAGLKRLVQAQNDEVTEQEAEGSATTSVAQ